MLITDTEKNCRDKPSEDIDLCILYYLFKSKNFEGVVNNDGIIQAIVCPS